MVAMIGPLPYTFFDFKGCHKWLKKYIRKNWGIKCKDFEIGCPVGVNKDNIMTNVTNLKGES